MQTKKVVGKTSTKKTVAKADTKKGTSKEKRALVCAPGEQCFWVTDGRILANLVELRDALAEMPEDVFTHHVTKERNDFADWIEHVLLDPELASAFRKSKKANTARDVVVSRIRICSI